MYYVETPAISSIIDVMKTTVWGESRFPARFLGSRHGDHISGRHAKRVLAMSYSVYVAWAEAARDLGVEPKEGSRPLFELPGH